MLTNSDGQHGDPKCKSQEAEHELKWQLDSLHIEAEIIQATRNVFRKHETKNTNKRGQLNKGHEETQTTEGTDFYGSKTGESLSFS